MASVPYPRSLKISKRVWHPCHTLFLYPLPMGAWVWQDAIPSYLSLTDGCMGMAGCHTLLFIPYQWVRGYGRDAIPSYLSLSDGCMGMAGCHTLLFTIYNQNHDKTYTSKPRQTQSKIIFSVCTNTLCLIYINKSAISDTFIHNKFAD